MDLSALKLNIKASLVKIPVLISNFDLEKSLKWL